MKKKINQWIKLLIALGPPLILSIMVASDGFLIFEKEVTNSTREDACFLLEENYRQNSNFLNDIFHSFFKFDLYQIKFKSNFIDQSNKGDIFEPQEINLNASIDGKAYKLYRNNEVVTSWSLNEKHCLNSKILIPFKYQNGKNKEGSFVINYSLLATLPQSDIMVRIILLIIAWFLVLKQIIEIWKWIIDDKWS